MSEREREVEAYLIREVTKNKGDVRKVGWIGRRGAPDRLVLFPDYKTVYWVELKSTMGVLSSAQVREIERLRACNQRVYVISSRRCVDEFIGHAKMVFFYAGMAE